MITTQRIYLLLSTLLASIMLTACNDSDYDGESQYVYTSIVTYTGNTGNTINFSYTYSKDGEPDLPIHLQCAGFFNKDVAAGTRLIAYYRYLNGGKFPQSGEISLISAAETYTAPVTTVETPPTILSLSPIRVDMVNRAGSYIDLYCQLPSVDKRTFSLQLDAATEGTDNPTLYISTEVPEGATGALSGCAASFDISSVWNNPATTAVTVKINNSNNPKNNTFTFKKP